ncbi:MBG domain-containing protein, partial [Pediococcus pentosaceus]|uniref:MBG domain-containing protein n=1 Tax=Pediococcus pentosaceus TaxID=1255 RepID=UPI003D785630
MEKIGKNVQEHYKMYKAGKFWIYTAIFTGFFLSFDSLTSSDASVLADGIETSSGIIRSNNTVNLTSQKNDSEKTAAVNSVSNADQRASSSVGASNLVARQSKVINSSLGDKRASVSDTNNSSVNLKSQNEVSNFSSNYTKATSVSTANSSMNSEKQSEVLNSNSSSTKITSSGSITSSTSAEKQDSQEISIPRKINSAPEVVTSGKNNSSAELSSTAQVTSDIKKSVIGDSQVVSAGTTSVKQIEEINPINNSSISLDLVNNDNLVDSNENFIDIKKDFDIISEKSSISDSTTMRMETMTRVQDSGADYSGNYTSIINLLSGAKGVYKGGGENYIIPNTDDQATMLKSLQGIVVDIQANYLRAGKMTNESKLRIILNGTINFTKFGKTLTSLGINIADEKETVYKGTNVVPFTPGTKLTFANQTIQVDIGIVDISSWSGLRIRFDFGTGTTYHAKFDVGVIGLANTIALRPTVDESTESSGNILNGKGTVPGSTLTLMDSRGQTVTTTVNPNLSWSTDVSSLMSGKISGQETDIYGDTPGMVLFSISKANISFVNPVNNKVLGNSATIQFGGFTTNNFINLEDVKSALEDYNVAHKTNYRLATNSEMIEKEQPDVVSFNSMFDTPMNVYVVDTGSLVINANAPDSSLGFIYRVDGGSAMHGTYGQIINVLYGSSVDITPDWSDGYSTSGDTSFVISEDDPVITGDVLYRKIIKIKDFAFTGGSKTYDGKTISTGGTLELPAGMATPQLEQGIDYSVSGPDRNLKNVGSYTVTLTAEGLKKIQDTNKN